VEQRKIMNIRNWIAYLLGVCIIQFGVAIFLELNLGSDPFTIFTQGVARTFEITPGMANRILTVIILGILLFCDRRYINIGTIVAIIGAGFVMDGMLVLVEPLKLETLPMVVRIVLFILNCGVIGIGFPMMKLSGLGLAPNDIIYMTLVEHLDKPYSVVRMSVDTVYLVLGFLMHGVVGIGTVICIMCLGPIMGLVMKHIEKYILMLLGKENAYYQ